jgi:two-component system, OmpR family, sensor histidine kinase KdpD
MSGRGRLKIFLGYAAGVGKTFRMLEESQRLKQEGRDIVVGYFEPHGRADTIAKTEGLEMVPRRRLEYRGCWFEEMDTDAVLRRRPAICAVDEFPHTNVPGSWRPKRWEDVVVLLEAGIDVLTTMNIQHLESLNDQVREISGVDVRETIPDWIVQEADEVVLIDVPPPALLNRLARGVVYPPEKAVRAMESFFKEPTLAALREMALRQTAHEVDLRQPGKPTGAGSEPRERILIHVTDGPESAALIRRGRRVADYLSGDCFAVAVLSHADARDPIRSIADAVQEHLAFARRLHVETHRLVSNDVAGTIVDFARRHGVTQILVANPKARSRAPFQRKSAAMQIVDLARDMQVTVVAERRAAGGTAPARP